MIRLVYILAASHSGSTLLAMLLGSHPDVCTIGELKATSLGEVDHYLCSCREEIRRCQFWMRVSQEMRRRELSFDITDAATDFACGASPYVKWLLRPLHRGPLLERLRHAALALSPTWRREYRRIQLRNIAFIESLCTVTGKRVVVDSSKTGIPQ